MTFGDVQVRDLPVVEPQDGGAMMSLTCAQWANLAAALLGAAGSIILVIFSWPYEPHQGAVWGSDAVTTENKRIDARNRQRHIWQRIGLGCLCVAFILQALAIFAWK
jgi:hypothetical protein